MVTSILEKKQNRTDQDKDQLPYPLLWLKSA